MAVGLSLCRNDLSGTVTAATNMAHDPLGISKTMALSDVAYSDANQMSFFEFQSTRRTLLLEGMVSH